MAAFALAPVGTFGETRRGEFFGSSFSNMDLGLFKRFSLPSGMRLQFRAESFNVFNKANFENPNTNVSGCGFGTITSAMDPRIMQFGWKFDF